jgi:FkbH-like protein
MTRYADALRESRAVFREGGKPAVTIEVFLGGNCTTEFLQPGLTLALARDRVGVRFRQGSFDGWVIDVMQGAADGCDAAVIWLSSLGLSAGGTDRRQPDCDAIAASIAKLIARDVSVIVVPPEPLVQEADPFSPFAAWRRDIVAKLTAALPREAITLPIEGVLWGVPAEGWAAGRYWSTAKAALHPDAVTAVGDLVGTALSRLLRPAVRAVVVDLDDTLWGGVVGEDGVEGLEIDADNKGRGFFEMQRFLKDLADQGVPICVASKNNPDDAESVFAQRRDMPLKREDFVYFDVSWDPKHLAIERIARELELGIDSVCFLDNSPIEREQARLHLPGLIVPDLPDDPEARVAALAASRLFMRPRVLKEDLLRTDQYKAEIRRRDLRDATADFDAYLTDLEMVLSIQRIGGPNLARVASLVQKTNQFNLTNRRHAPQALAALGAARDSYAYCFQLSDKFGDAGIIAVVIAVPEGDTLAIDTWLMSCRVLQRGVEHAVAKHLSDWARARGFGKLRGIYAPSSKNGQVAKFYESYGLARDGDGGGCVAFVGETLKAGRHFIELREVALTDLPG